MKRLTIRLVIAFITFGLGVTVVTLWLDRHRSPERTPTSVSAPSMIQPAPPPAHPASRDEEYAVYSALLDGVWISPGDGGKIKLLVINDQTSVDDYSPEKVFKMYKEPLTPALSAALRDYNVKNGQPRQLTKSFDIKFDYALVSKREFDAFFKGKNLGEDWESYYRKYPGSPGYISLSRVGFSPGMAQAVVYMEYVCGSLCSNGSYFILSKENGEWRETKKIHFLTS